MNLPTKTLRKHIIKSLTNALNADIRTIKSSADALKQFNEDNKKGI